MKVYVLQFNYYEDSANKGVFSSYSAMVNYLFNKFNYTSELEREGWFKKMIEVDGCKYNVEYDEFEVIGEHSHKTNTIQFN